MRIDVDPVIEVYEALSLKLSHKLHDVSIYDFRDSLRAGWCPYGKGHKEAGEGIVSAHTPIMNDYKDKPTSLYDNRLSAIT